MPLPEQNCGQETESLAAEILIIGNELVSADISDAVRRYLSDGLLKLGISIERTSIVGDEEGPIEHAIKRVLKSGNINLLIAAGGLGPDSGYITSKVAARVTGKRLVISNEMLMHIRQAMETEGRNMVPSDERQALIPQKVEVIKGPGSPACGYLLKEKEKILVFLPGSVSTIKFMAQEVLLPLLAEELPEGALVFSKVFHTFGLSLEEIKESLPESLLSMEFTEISFLPSVDEIALRVTVKGKRGEEVMNEITRTMRECLGMDLFAEDGETMEETVGALLIQNGESLSIAESCTGGSIGSRITNVPGSSEYFEMGIVSYSNESKTKLLGVDPKVIEEKGAVSSEVALEMALGARRLGGTTYGLSVTGIAGPQGGSEEKPVGTVYIGLSSAEGELFQRYIFSGSRDEVRRQSVQAALDLLRRNLLRY